VTTPSVLEPQAIPQPLRLHWGFVLVLSALTLGLFGGVWLVVQAHWMRKIRGGWFAEGFAIGYAALTLIALSSRLSPSSAAAWVQSDYWGEIGFAFWIAAVYTLRHELMAEPIGLFLGRFVPVLFGPVYFQYHLQEYGGTSRSGKPLGL